MSFHAVAIDLLLQIFSEDGKSVLHSLLSSDIRSDVTEAARMLCIASIPGTKSLFIGWSDGKVTALELAMDVSIPEKKFTEKGTSWFSCCLTVPTVSFVPQFRRTPLAVLLQPKPILPWVMHPGV